MRATALLVALAGCGFGTGERTKLADERSVSSKVSVVHDEDRGVTCWTYDGYRAGGISCLPDSQLKDGGK